MEQIFIIARRIGNNKEVFFSSFGQDCFPVWTFHEIKAHYFSEQDGEKLILAICNLENLETDELFLLAQ